MNRIWKLTLILLGAVVLLCGCSVQTIGDLYCLPKRSEEFMGLQSAIEKVMTMHEYCAPISGENQQTVQSADLDGDGKDEYILYAKSTAEKPLHIFIFGQKNGSYVLLDSIDSNGSAFEQVEYVQMNDRPGLEIVIGRQVSNQVLRSVSVYTLASNEIEQVMTANYTKFLCTDLDNDSLTELMILRPGIASNNQGVAELFGFEENNIERSAEIAMSGPAETIKRIMIGKLNDGVPAVYVATSVDNNTIITDVYAMVRDTFSNISLSNDSGTSVQTLRNYYVYADDIDDDGVLELPSLITMKAPIGTAQKDQYLIRWYAMTSRGREVDKMYTYHNFVGGWYMQLDSNIASRFSVIQLGNSYEFYVWDKQFNASEKLMTVYVLTGQKREEQAVTDNRFVIYRSDTTVYAANLEVASAAYGMSRDSLIQSFRLILQDWKTGET